MNYPTIFDSFNIDAAVTYFANITGRVKRVARCVLFY
jgi:hypothetical protein